MQSDPWVGGQPVPDGGMLVGAVVVEHHMELSARVGAGDELEEARNSVCRCRSKQRPVTLPVATSKVANRLVMPCRT
jgi:hypothetical protein